MATKQQLALDIAKKKEMFLRHLRISCNITASAEAAGWDRRTAKHHRDNDEEFRIDWDDALEQSTDLLEGALRDRAINGVEEPVFHQGVVVGYVTKYSDSNGQFLLKAHRRELFGDKVAMDVKATGGVILLPQTASVEDWEKAAEEDQAKHRGNQSAAPKKD
jgi:hypothetical protein